MVIICYEAKMAWRILLCDVCCMNGEKTNCLRFSLVIHIVALVPTEKYFQSFYLCAVCCVYAAWKYYFFTLLLFILISVIFNLIAWSKTISQLVLVIFTIFLCRLILVMFLLLLLMSVQIEKYKKRREEKRNMSWLFLRISAFYEIKLKIKTFGIHSMCECKTITVKCYWNWLSLIV